MLNKNEKKNNCIVLVVKQTNRIENVMASVRTQCNDFTRSECIDLFWSFLMTWTQLKIYWKSFIFGTNGTNNKNSRYTFHWVQMSDIFKSSTAQHAHNKIECMIF